ncbi:MAG: KpsF/GutQ family sugar-phosphate isomerase [Negativicutes bacterium]|nr:KpsF/GutQ family sugar-phosphate isomerase [Negativicutes bacterium]
MDRDELLSVARRCLTIEAEAVAGLARSLDDSFCRAVQMVAGCAGKVVVTGIGKAGHVARKVAATLSSTGTPAIYLHPVEGLHGDSGVIARGDVVLAISNSGETEVLGLLPHIKRCAVRLVAMTGRAQSSLARNADVVLLATVEREACPLGLAPTASTTAMLAMGDALAVAVLAERGFTAEQFAVLHPAGALGKKLLLTVADVMRSGEASPVVGCHCTVQQALFEITAKGAGAVMVTGDDGRLLGLITDGDIRRALRQGRDFLDREVTAIMTRTPKVVAPACLAAEALQIMESNQPTPITVLPVVEQGRAVGLVHITDLARQGVV